MSDIQILKFDSEIFGFKIGKFIGKKLSSEKGNQIVRYCKDNNIKCLYSNLDINDFETLNTASKHGFVISDIRITFEKDLTNFEANKKVKINGYKIDDKIKKTDVPYLELLSKEISRVSRFVFDRNFPKGSGEKLYTAWMINSINTEAADKVFIAREIKTEKPIGVVTCKNESDHGEIVLVGVSKGYSGREIASFILNHALCFFKENGFRKVRVVTQGGNVPAQRLYQKNGFVTYSTSVFFHLWIK